MIYLTSFATEGEMGTRWCIDHQKRLHEHFAQWGIQAFPDPLGWQSSAFRKTPFYRAHERILSQPRIAGYGLWRPYIIMHALMSCAPGDVVAYCDVEVMASEDPRPWFEKARADHVFSIATGFPNREWCRGDTFYRMGCMSPEYLDAPQIWDGVSAFARTPKAFSILAEWLHFCMDAYIVTDVPSEIPNAAQWRDHRHEQAVLTNILIRHDIKPYTCTAFKDA